MKGFQSKTRTRIQHRYSTIWEIAESMWTHIQPLLPPEKPPGTVGRPALSNWQVYQGVVYVLRTGCQWKSLHTAWFGAASSIHAHFQAWCRSGIWHKVFQSMLKLYDHHQRIQWRWQALDSKSVPAPLGGQKTGPNPTDRGKYGSKRHVLVDARGAPLAITISAANLHDSQAALSTLHALPLTSPMQNPRRVYRIHHLCADKAYDAQSVRQGAEQMGYRTHIPHRTGTSQHDNVAQASAPDEPARKYPARRWVVEPSHAWQNQFRSLRVRWLKKEANWLGFIELAAGLILFRMAIYG